MNTTSALSKLSGTLARLSPFKREERRFLCPNCLHFGGFAYACGECWAEMPDYGNRKEVQQCPGCERLTLSADGDGVKAYCKQCKGNCDRAIYHQRQVRVLATLRPADSQSLCRAINGQEYQPQGGKGYVYDDGSRLAYVLNLSDLTGEVHSLPPTHALWEAESIWVDVSASNPKELALEWGEAADRFINKAGLTKAQRRAMTICVQQAEADPVVKPVLKTRFGKVRYGVVALGFLYERMQTKAAALGNIGQNSTVPARIAELKGNDSSWAAEALVKIGKPAVPALIAALKVSDSGVRWRAAEVLVKIGKPDVPALIAALNDSNVYGPVASVLIRIGEAETLVKIGKPAVPALIATLKESDVYRTEANVSIKINGKPVPVTPGMIASLNRSDLDVREKAAAALWKIGDFSAVPALEAADRKYHYLGGCNFCFALRQLGAK